MIRPDARLTLFQIKQIIMSKVSFHQVWTHNETNLTSPASSTADNKSTDVCLLRTSHRNGKSGILQVAEPWWLHPSKQISFLFLTFNNCAKVFPPSICILPMCTCHCCMTQLVTENLCTQAQSSTTEAKNNRTWLKDWRWKVNRSLGLTAASVHQQAAFPLLKFQAGASKALHIVFSVKWWMLLRWFRTKRKHREPS